MGRETRGLSRKLIVQVDGVTEGKRPEVTMIMLGPSKGGKNHDGTAGTDGVLNGVLSDSVVVMTADATVFDALTLGGQLSSKFLRGIDTIVGTVVTNVNADGGSLSFKGELGLNSFGPSKPDLMDRSKFPAGGVTEDGATTVFLACDIIPTSRELTTKKR
jgi:hypothetical protein